MDPVMLFSKATARGADYEAGRATVLAGLAESGASERTCRSPLGFDWTIEQATAQDRLLGAMGRQP